MAHRKPRRANGPPHPSLGHRPRFPRPRGIRAESPSHRMGGLVDESGFQPCIRRAAFFPGAWPQAGMNCAFGAHDRRRVSLALKLPLGHALVPEAPASRGAAGPSDASLSFTRGRSKASQTLARPIESLVTRGNQWMATSLLTSAPRSSLMEMNQAVASVGGASPVIFAPSIVSGCVIHARFWFSMCGAVV